MCIRDRTITLLLNSEGKKMGKTASGAVWLDPNKTTPFDFYQYWRNVGDADVLKCIRMLTFLPLEQIDAMDAWEGSQLNQAKEILAYELTKLVHGEDEANKAQEAARALFGGSGSSENMPATQLPAARFTDGKIGAIELLVACGLCASNGEARRLIQQGGVAVNDQKVASIDVTDVYKRQVLLCAAVEADHALRRNDPGDVRAVIRNDGLRGLLLRQRLRLSQFVCIQTLLF